MTELEIWGHEVYCVHGRFDLIGNEAVSYADEAGRQYIIILCKSGEVR
jgi:hypothetical protein